MIWIEIACQSHKNQFNKPQIFIYFNPQSTIIVQQHAKWVSSGGFSSTKSSLQQIGSWDCWHKLKNPTQSSSSSRRCGNRQQWINFHFFELLNFGPDFPAGSALALPFRNWIGGEAGAREMGKWSETERNISFSGRNLRHLWSRALARREVILRSRAKRRRLWVKDF